MFYSKTDEKVSFAEAERLVEVLENNENDFMFLMIESGVHGELGQEEIAEINKWLKKDY